MRRVFILAAGEQTRWEGPGLKQLVDVYGSPLLIRTINQVEQYLGVTPIIVTHKTELQIEGITSICPKNRKSAIASFRSISEFFHDDTVILFGDVFYTDAFMMHTLRDAFMSKGPITFFGRNHDVFAVRFAYYQTNVMLEFSEKVKTFWELHRSFGQATFKQHILVEDETQDFDNVRDYEMFVEYQQRGANVESY